MRGWIHAAKMVNPLPTFFLNIPHASSAKRDIGLHFSEGQTEALSKEWLHAPHFQRADWNTAGPAHRELRDRGPRKGAGAPVGEQIEWGRGRQQGSGGGWASGAGRSLQSQLIRKGLQVRSRFGRGASRHARHINTRLASPGRGEAETTPQHSEPEAATVNSLARPLTPFLRHRLSSGGSGEGAGEGPPILTSPGAGRGLQGPLPRREDEGGATGVGAGSPKNWGSARAVRPSLGDLSSLGSDGSHLKNGGKKLDLETMDFWERGPRPRPEETKPDKDTPRPGGVRAGPEGETSL